LWLICDELKAKPLCETDRFVWVTVFALGETSRCFRRSDLKNDYAALSCG
jgi:hypothetical protein